MKLTNVLLSILFATITIYAFATNTFADKNYNRKNFQLELLPNGKFKSSDTVFLSIPSGNWKIKNKTINFSKQLNDSVLITEKAALIFSSDNKISFLKNGTKFSYHDKASSNLNPIISFISILKGILGMLVILFVAYIFSKF